MEPGTWNVNVERECGRRLGAATEKGKVNYEAVAALRPLPLLEIPEPRTQNPEPIWNVEPGTWNMTNRLV